MIEKKSFTRILQKLAYLPDRTPEMAFKGGAGPVFAAIAPYRNGAIFVGYYSGDTEWERHTGGDEIVACIEGRTTVVLLMNGARNRIDLKFGEILVVPQGCWHRFENSTQLKVVSVTPEPTDHSLDSPRQAVVG